METKNNITREEWIATLRSFVGTRFQHQGRAKGIGVDCIGLLATAGGELGVMPEKIVKFKSYARSPQSGLFHKIAGEHLQQLPYNRLQALEKQILPGDIIFFWIDKRGRPRHMAVYTGTDENGLGLMIHAHAAWPRAVVEMPLHNGYWQQRIDSIWRLPAFTEE